MSLQVDQFKQKLSRGGARANLFKVHLNFPGVAGGDTELASFLITTGEIPASAIEAISVPVRGGRTIKVIGDRTDFTPITFTVLNDEDFKLRKAFEKWLNAANGHASNKRTGELSDLYQDFQVDQLDRDEKVIQSYKFVGGWPTNVSNIALGYATNNAIEEFTVEMTYQYWTNDESTS